MKWIEALKKWNAARGGRYTVPRKGTPEHAEVRELMGGNAKSSGYVKLMYAKKVLGRTVDDYDPADVEDLREKKSDKRFRPSKISNASRALRMKYGTEAERKAIQEEVATEKKQRTAKRVASAYKPSLVEQLKKGKVKKAEPIEEEEEAEEMEFVPKPSRAEAIAQEARAARAAKPKATGGAKKPKKKSYSAADAAADMKALGVGKKKKKVDEKKPVKETGQISMMMRIGNHVMVAEPQPATIKVKGNLGELQTDADAPATGHTGFENRPKETSAAAAARKFNPEELRVRPLSELFMTKPAKGLVEEQLQGKGCWWKRELDEF